MDYKYITRFDAAAKAIEANDDVKKEAFASLIELQALMPKDFNPQAEPDLLYMASPLVLVGKCNLNGDCLDKQGAVARYKTFVKKLLDVEHNREKIVGNIFAVALTEVDTNRILTEEEALQKDLFNISYAAYMWRVANPKLAEFVSMASNENSEYFNSVSSSFEVGFDEYKIAVGSTTLSAAKILSTEEAPAYEKYLKSNGGKGVDEDGNHVYRVLASDWAGRGAGLVARPASQVKGVLTIEKMAESALEVVEKEADKKDDTEATINMIKELQKKNEELFNEFKKAMTTLAEKDAKASDTKILEKNNIQLKNDGVITNTAKPMKITKLEDIVANKADLFKNEASAADIAQLIADETAKISEEYVAKLKEKENIAKFLEEAKAAAETKAKELETKSAELAAKVQELASQLNKIEEAKAAEIAEKLFQERMSGLDAEFELDEESRAFVAEDIKGLSEEAFTVYAKKAKALFKKKAAKCSKDGGKCMEPDKDDAKAALDAKEAVAAATPDTKQAGLPNGVVASETIADRMKKAFGTDSVKVNGKEIKASNKQE